MDEKKFNMVLTLLVPQVIELIMKNYSLDEIAASRELYKSRLYALLEQEDTKIWHLSPLTLFNMYDDEKQRGFFDVPEEA